MTTVVGIRFREAGKTYYFEPGQDELEQGMRVIVETARGQEIGTVVLRSREVPDKGSRSAFKKGSADCR
jgi:cell fate regulator YaaT (PSP1 superfamily)